MNCIDFRFSSPATSTRIKINRHAEAVYVAFVASSHESGFDGDEQHSIV